jgi:hypothetical protein
MRGDKPRLAGAFEYALDRAEQTATPDAAAAQQVVSEVIAEVVETFTRA